MTEFYKDYKVEKSLVLPTRIIESSGIEKSEELLIEKPTAVFFRTDKSAVFKKSGSYIILDFGKELCGGIRIIRNDFSEAQFRITLGESVSEACSYIGQKNATNDHALRDFTANLTLMTDSVFGNSGYRFARIELLSENPVFIQSIIAESKLPLFENEATIETADEMLNSVISTAAYTLKLNLQNGFIWDGIKRDRLVWSGDLHQEIIGSLYLFGDNVNVKNSLSFLREYTPDNQWINNIPSYSAWWIINLCDYYRYSGNKDFFEKNKDYAYSIFNKFNDNITDNGELSFSGEAFLDWPTKDTDDAITGTALIIIIAAQRFLSFESNEACRNIIGKLKKYLNTECIFKQTRAFRILAGCNSQDDKNFLEKNGASGFSTFMAYYILTAYAISGGDKILEIIKEYFGGMISRGATTFWEDFDIEWLNNSGRIDELPKDGEKDIHGDFGSYCYKGFRHSLCHGWASGVLSFVIETLFGIKYNAIEKTVSICPHKTTPDFKITMPISDGILSVSYKNKSLVVSAPQSIKII